MPIDIFTDKKLQIFDLGNVLYSVDARLSFAALQRLGMPAFEGPISNSHAACGDFALYSDGKISTPQFYDAVRRVCHVQATDAQIRDAWNAMLIGFRPDALQQVRQLRQSGYTVVLLSNCNDLHADIVRQQYPGPDSFDSLFDKVFFSQEIHISKPDPRAWQLVLHEMNAQPADAAFYDDSLLNVQAAQALGIASRQII